MHNLTYCKNMTKAVKEGRGMLSVFKLLGYLVVIHKPQAARTLGGGGWGASGFDSTGVVFANVPRFDLFRR